MSEEPQRILVCPPYSEANPTVPASRDSCASCGGPVSVARSSAALILRFAPRILCWHCADTELDGVAEEEVAYRRAWVRDDWKDDDA
jgi:hypothetical protein